MKIGSVKFAASLLALPAAMACAQAATVTATTPTPSVAVGDAVSIVIGIADLGDGTPPSLSAFDLDLLFDDALLSYQDASFGPALGGDVDVFADAILTSPGVLDLSALSFLTAEELDMAQPGAFTLVILSFEALAAGATDLQLIVDALADSLGLPIDATMVSGVRVEIGGSAIPLPGAALLLLSGLVAGAGAARRKAA